MLNVQVATVIFGNNEVSYLLLAIDRLEAHLWNRKAQLSQLCLSHQRDVDAVWKDQVGVDDILDDVVTKATGKESQNRKKKNATNICISQISLASRRSFGMEFPSLYDVTTLTARYSVLKYKFSIRKGRAV